jgi:hypothetical protein
MLLKTGHRVFSSADESERQNFYAAFQESLQLPVNVPPGLMSELFYARLDLKATRELADCGVLIEPAPVNSKAADVEFFR